MNKYEEILKDIEFYDYVEYAERLMNDAVDKSEYLTDACEGGLADQTLMGISDILKLWNRIDCHSKLFEDETMSLIYADIREQILLDVISLHQDIQDDIEEGDDNE